jgi:hypothetical protein
MFQISLLDTNYVFTINYYYYYYYYYYHYINIIITGPKWATVKKTYQLHTVLSYLVCYPLYMLYLKLSCEYGGKL